MGFPIRTCVACDEEFELRPGKPGFANRCPECSVENADANAGGASTADASEKRAMDEARRDAMRNLLYRKDS